MKRFLAGTIVLFAVAGCSAAPSKTQPRPGMWQWSSKTAIVEVTGLPPAIADRLRAGGAPPPPPGSMECISPKEAARDITELAKGQNDGNCRFTNLKSSQGSFSGTADCGQPSDPMRGKGDIKGTVAPEEMHITVNMTVSLPGAKDAKVLMRMQRDGKRIGECSAPNG